MNTELSTLRHQLLELADRHRNGAIDDEAYEQTKKMIEGRIVAIVLESRAADAAASTRPSLTLMAGLSIAAVAAAAAGYMWLGTRTASTAAPAASTPAARAGAPATSAAGDDKSGSHAVNSAQISAMVDRLAARLKEQPDNGDGWAMLARSYAVTGRHSDAVPAFRKAAALKKDDPVLLADYADALAVTQDRRLAGEPLALVEQALRLDPNNVKALSLAGSAAFERKDFAGAIQHWERLVGLVPPDSPFLQRAKDGVAEARELSGKKARNPSGK
jgi:cytochrome c-type biogenesis protein CcmH